MEFGYIIRYVNHCRDCCFNCSNSINNFGCNNYKKS